MIDANCFWLFSKCGKDFLKVIFSLNDGKNKEYAIKDDDKLYKFFAV